MACPFCNLETLRIVEENENAVVFFSNPRLKKGHLLVTPKRHVEKPWELTEEETTDVFRLVRKYQQILSEELGTGSLVKQNYLPFLPESKIKIHHVHYHILPRTCMDEIYNHIKTESELFADLSEEEIREVSEILKAKVI